MYVSAIIVAAGKGARITGNIPKQFLKLENETILAHTIDKFESCTSVNEIIVVLSEEYFDFFKTEIIDKYKYKKISNIANGGATRQQSVLNGLRLSNKKSDVVLVHDAARPFIKISEIEATADFAFNNASCVLGVKVKDTIKVCDDNNIILNTPNREMLWQIQTPQAFKYDLLMKAHETAVKDDFIGTDDASLVERLGYKTHVVAGSYDNIKITTDEDLLIGELILKRQINL